MTTEALFVTPAEKLRDDEDAIPKTMELHLDELIERFEEGGYNQEDDHMLYDMILEWYILNPNPYITDRIKRLVLFQKNFWYA